MFMKKLGILLIIFMGAVLSSQAQVDSTAKKVGNKTAEVASKGKSSVVDEVYKDKVGPAGQSPIYIDHESKYYYVDKKGKKVYVPKSSLKDKPKG
jgi:hypothetical protein